MMLGDSVRNRLNSLKVLAYTVPAMVLAGPLSAQEAAEVPAEGAEAAAAAAAPAYEYYGPEMIKGQPIAGGLDVQGQFSPIGESALGLHNALVWIMAIICIFVLGLLLYVILRFNKKANPVPSKTSHNTVLEVVWTGLPVLILVLIAVPSLGLLAKQYESPPADAVTIKVNGYQWYWGYEYPDHGVSEIISNMMPQEEAEAKGFPHQLEVDNRLVVPVGVPLRMQVVGKDVIHSFAVPSLWFKMDAVPGRLNEKMMQVDEPGIYYGQCSELCGARHGYMPIAIEAVPMERFEQWVASQGGAMPGAAAEEPALEEAAAEDAPAADAAEAAEAAPAV